MRAKPTDLPIDHVLGDLKDALAEFGRALLIAPPGAGKTTRVAPALLAEQWCSGQIFLLVPRRLAARAAAEFMASERGEKAGGTIGYLTRLDSKCGPSTRIFVMTHGVFLARLQKHPDLAGVSALLFDEVHERGIDNDLALALALDSANALRPDLKLLAMSATLDGRRYGKILGSPPLIESSGRSYPLEVRHVGRDPTRPVEEQVAAACRRALAEHDGSLLAFLPGIREIERTARALGDPGADIVVHKLHGGADPAAQRAALAASPAGKRKIVLATAIAETSLTLEGVRIVVDSGLARRPQFDPGAGLTRLVTGRASRASVVQRAGRAARQAPGVALRLWEEAANGALPEQEPAEILQADLSALVLTCLMWGERDPGKLPFLDPPPASALAEARSRLARMGAIDDEGAITPHGRAIAAFPLEPRLAHMMLEAAELGLAPAAAAVAMLLTERGLGGNEQDLELRWRRWSMDRSPRSEAARAMARRLVGLATQGGGAALRGLDPQTLGIAVALGFPERVSRRRDSQGESWQSVGGRGFRADSEASLTRADWLAVAEVSGPASGARIMAAAPIDEQRIVDVFGDRVTVLRETRFDPASRAIRSTVSRRLGAITLSSGPDPKPDPAAVEAALLDAVTTHGPGILPWHGDSERLMQRAAFAAALDPGIAKADDAALAQDLESWLVPLVSGKRSLDAIDPRQLHAVLESIVLGVQSVRAIDRLAPDQFVSPAGTRHAIDYDSPGGPRVEVRAQALYGLKDHPTVGGGKIPLTLAITSPAGRPIQTSRDLPAFWAGSWREVAKEMRGRYPRHDWPDDPAAASPGLATKRRRGNN